MTYREQIQALLKVIELAYDLAGGIRDTADVYEKEAFNEVRRLTRQAEEQLRFLDQALDRGRASMKLSDGVKNYIKKATEEFQ